MTKIYIYCLFDTFDNFLGVYSSLKAIHRDALRIAGQGPGDVFLVYDGKAQRPTLTTVRNLFKGKQDIEVRYRAKASSVRVYKTRLKE